MTYEVNFSGRELTFPTIEAAREFADGLDAYTGYDIWTNGILIETRLAGGTRRIY